MQQENDMDWDEENSSERISRNHKNRTVQATAAERVGEEIQCLEQPADGDFNNTLDINAEIQMQFRKLRDQVAEEIAKEMAKMTAQLTEELSQAREQLTQARRELEDTRLQLQAMEVQEAPVVRPAYADIARQSLALSGKPPFSMARQICIESDPVLSNHSPRSVGLWPPSPRGPFVL